MRNSSCRLIWTFSVMCALGAVGLLAPSISDASTTAASSIGPNSCSPSNLSQPFARWLDYAQYELTPGGDFESSMWTMTGGAKLIAGSEPYAVTGTLGSSSLSLPHGASAHSPLTCVGAAYPSLRFFIAGTGSVAVSVVDGSVVVPAGLAVAGGKWAPTPVMLTNSALLAASSGGTTQVSVRLRGVSGSPRVDDVFVDPWSRG